MRKRFIHWGIFLIVMIALLIVAAIVSLSSGEMDIDISNFREILQNPDGIEYTVLSRIRLPRLILAISVGGALSLSGAILQGIYRNPLVEPYTLGISGGAALGVAIAIVFGLQATFGGMILPLFGFTGAIITLFLVYFLSISRGALSINSMLLIGVMVSFVASSAMMFMMSMATSDDLHSIVFWIMGSLDESNFVLIRTVLIASVVGLIVSYLFAQPLNALRLGEAKAKHLGINTSVSIRILFVVASLMTGIAVAVAGVIGFVGLVIPHLIRLIIGNDYRIILAGSFLGGAIFLIICDTISRTVISPNELPIGVISGLVGGIVFIVVLTRSKSKVKLG